MPDHVYEVLAQGARYWFLFWMALIVWRSWRWYRKDRRAARKRLKLLPDAGFVGEMVVMNGAERGTVYPVPREGTLGRLRTNDICLPDADKRHLWFRFDDRKGLMVEPVGKNAVNVDGEEFKSRREPLYMAHGSWLTVGQTQLRLRLFAGFESVGHAVRRGGVEVSEEQQPQQQGMSPEQFAQMQQMLQRQWQMQQMQAWQQGYQQAMAQQQAAQEADKEPEWAYEDDALPYDMAQIAKEEGMVDNTIYMRPAGEKKPEIPQEEFYPPVMDDDMDDWVLDDEPPKSEYVGDDEAAQAKRAVWDKYFGGGAKR